MEPAPSCMSEGIGIRTLMHELLDAHWREGLSALSLGDAGVDPSGSMAHASLRGLSWWPCALSALGTFGYRGGCPGSAGRCY